MRGFAMLLGVLSLAVLPAEARISKGKFNATESITAGKLFMAQVDMVSLYLSTDHVVYVPRLTEVLKLRVNLTLLGMGFGQDQKAMQDFVMRHISSFNKTLVERLSFYTPELARDFNPNEDVEFLIQVGPERKSIAVWRGGAWTWANGKEEKISELLEKPGKPCKRRCPALLKKKTEKVARADS